MGLQAIDDFVRDLSDEVHATVHDGAKSTSEKRDQVIHGDFADDLFELRTRASEIKQHALERLDDYLDRAVDRLEAHGARVHFATDGAEANAIVHGLLTEADAKRLVKAKSMATEEIGLLPYLEERGIEVVETDLGEFIVQIDGDRPSHIVKPIMHKNRRGIGESFERERLGPYSEDPETLTMMARAHLRRKYLSADAGMTGANFVSAESGRLVVVTNEGNARFSLAATRLHVAVVGIEKVVPTDRDLAVMLSLLARSATGQRLSVYTQFLSGPKVQGQQDGPEAMHVVFLDNGRSEVLASHFREILRCCRCGACLNVCPVYRQASGHAYRTVYPGPVGSVLSPLLAGEEGAAELADLPKACSLCGACTEVCPVRVPLSDMLVRLRDEAKTKGHAKAMAGTPSMKPYAMLAGSPATWRAALWAGGALNLTPEPMQKMLPAASAWLSSRDLPRWRGGAFRRWMRDRKKEEVTS
jgi:L-lactate dehydrogenase complex protein LldF